MIANCKIPYQSNYIAFSSCSYRFLFRRIVIKVRGQEDMEKCKSSFKSSQFQFRILILFRFSRCKRHNDANVSVKCVESWRSKAKLLISADNDVITNNSN